MDISFKENITSTSYGSTTLNEIIQGIMSEDMFEEIEGLRREPSDDVRKNIKMNLPVFYPTLRWRDDFRDNDNVIPTGILQFDVDLGDNNFCDIIKLRSFLVGREFCSYFFYSPSGGLKFGVLTDFQLLEGESGWLMIKRFEKAWVVVRDYLQSLISFTPDESTKSMVQGCYLSFDRNAFHNPNATPLKVNDQFDRMDVADLSKPQCENIDDMSVDATLEVLQFIPRDLRYIDRYKINAPILRMHGLEVASNILVEHWSKRDKEQLRRQLSEQMPSAKFGDIRHLINTAKRNGFKEVGTKLLRQRKPKPVSTELPNLYSLSEAELAVEMAVSNFFKFPKNTYLKVSTGVGKTRAVIDQLTKLSVGKKVLVVVPNHELAEQFAHDYKEAVKERSKIRDARFRRSLLITKTGGRRRECYRPDVVRCYEEAEMAFPVVECLSNCPFNAECPYINQFDMPSEIRVMTHDELFNEPSPWSGGYTSEYLPRKQRWSPDVIVVDENWMRQNIDTETSGSEYNSLRAVINSCYGGASVENAALKSAELIMADYKRMRHEPDVEFIDTKQYISDKSRLCGGGRSQILARLREFVSRVSSRNDSCGVEFDSNSGSLEISEIRRFHKRYADTPKLFLDATAERGVVESVMKDVNFIQIDAKLPSSSNIFQQSNKSWARQQLVTESNVHELVSTIKETIDFRRYKRIGVITYKTTKFCDSLEEGHDFDAYLSKRLGVHNYSHFGGLRGLNTFGECDCLIVVGRQCLPQDQISDLCKCVFYDDAALEMGHMDMLGRTKCDGAYAITNFSYVDQNPRKIHKHFGRSESIQAIGRARLYRGGPKDVYVFSNEVLGLETEITEYFQVIPPKYTDKIQKLLAVGASFYTPRHMRNFGFSDYALKSDRALIISEMKGAGFCFADITVKDKHRKWSNKTVVYSDINALNYMMSSRDWQFL